MDVDVGVARSPGSLSRMSGVVTPGRLCDCVGKVDIAHCRVSNNQRCWVGTDRGEFCIPAVALMLVTAEGCGNPLSGGTTRQMTWALESGSSAPVVDSPVSQEYQICWIAEDPGSREKTGA